MERCLNIEMGVHLESTDRDRALVEESLSDDGLRPTGGHRSRVGVKGGKNRRNGSSKKTIKGEFGELEIQIPEIVMPNLSRNLSLNIRRGLRDLTIKSLHFTAEE